LKIPTNLNFPGKTIGINSSGKKRKNKTEKTKKP
jgi:hypothetical protein